MNAIGRYRNSLPIFLFLIVACSRPSGPHLDVSPPPPSVNLSDVTYEKIRPIFAQYCSACHPSRSPPDWLDYTQAKKLAQSGELLKRIFVERSMPPPGTAQAARITTADRAKIAEWIRSGGPRDSSSPRSPPTAGPKMIIRPVNLVASRCTQCHGITGPSSENQPKIPILAGQSEQYLKWQLEAFKWRGRLDPSGIMNDEAADLYENEINEVSHYYSNMKGLPLESVLPSNPSLTVRRGQKLAEQYCVSCHMNPFNNNRPSGPLIPILAGQSKRYLIYQLLYFRNGERKSALMNAFAKNLTNQQIAELADFFTESCKRTH